MSNIPTQTKASKVIESWKNVFNESTITTQDVPNFDAIKNTLQVQGNLLSVPAMPHISTITLDNHQYTMMDSSHPQSPSGMQDSLTSSPEGIEHIKSLTSNVNPTDK